MTQETTSLHEAVTSWLGTLDVLMDRRAAGRFECLHDGLSTLVPLARTAEPGPLRDAVLELGERYDDLRVLATAGLDLSAETKAAAVARVLERFDALVRVAEA